MQALIETIERDARAAGIHIMSPATIAGQLTELARLLGGPTPEAIWRSTLRLFHQRG